MANTNTLTNVIPQILAQGMEVLRENCVMPRLVNTDYDDQAKEQGDSIDIPIAGSIAVNDVTPSYVAPDDTGVTPTKVTLELDQWKEAPFFLTDKDVKNAMSGIIPLQAAEAVKKLATTVDAAILGLYKDVYSFAGTPGVTPFGTTMKEATDANKLLSDNYASKMDRRYVMNTSTEANALNLRPLMDASFSGDARAINDGQIVHKLGLDWFMDQNMPTHLNGAQDSAYVVNGANALAAKTLAIKTGTGDIHKGDILTIAGDTQTYVVTTLDAGGASGVTLAISPGLKIATSGNEVITFKGTLSTTYDQDLVFQRDAFVFASRPLMDVNIAMDRTLYEMSDPISGLSMRLEVKTQHKRTRFSFDILYGVLAARPELACRVFGA